MTETKEQQNTEEMEKKTEETQADSNDSQNESKGEAASLPRAERRPRTRNERKNPRRGGKKDGRVRSEFDHKTVSIRRVTRVVAGGRRFSFAVTLVAGNRKGMVGVGEGKATDTPVAIDKALRDAKKRMVTVPLTKDMSIPFDIEAKFGASRVKMMPAPGRGLLAGSSVRTVLELAGVTGVNAKLLSGSKNRANNAKVAIAALEKLARQAN